MSQREGATLLEHALLGLMYEKPSSGYDLRKIFATTSMGSFSDSPGAIYPALRRLERKGLVTSKPQANSGRRRQVVSLTAEGKAELKQWISLPITRRDVINGLQEFMLRFAFAESVMGASCSTQLLEQLRAELRAHISELKQQFETLGPQMPRAGRLALESGIMGYDALLQWCKRALTAYRTVSSASQ